MFYKDIKQEIEKQEIIAGDKITILFKNDIYDNKTSKVPSISKIEVIFERLETNYFMYFLKEKDKPEYKILSRIGGIEKLTCQIKSL